MNALRNPIISKSWTNVLQGYKFRSVKTTGLPELVFARVQTKKIKPPVKLTCRYSNHSLVSESAFKRLQAHKMDPHSCLLSTGKLRVSTQIIHK